MTEEQDSVDRIATRIGTLSLTYTDPSVSVTTEQRTVEHETIDNTIVVQTLGRRAANITINAVLTEHEAQLVDGLTEQGVVYLRSERFSGNVVVTAVDTSYRRERDLRGRWLYDGTIDCLEAE